MTITYIPPFDGIPRGTRITMGTRVRLPSHDNQTAVIYTHVQTEDSCRPDWYVMAYDDAAYNNWRGIEIQPIDNTVYVGVCSKEELLTHCNEKVRALAATTNG